MSQKTVTEPGTRLGTHQLATLLDSTQELIAILGSDGTVLFANEAFRHSLGYNPEELLGRSIHAIVHASDVAHIRERLQEVAALPGSSDRERCRLRTRDCSWRWFELVCHNRLHDSGIEGILLNAQDV
ncbi:MAG: PAS domain-containing protein, partial [Candidatus Acidiferrum sp.]